MPLTLEVIGQDVTATLAWKTFRYTESIGQPDELSVEAIGFTVDPGFTQPAQDLFAVADNYRYAVAKLGDDVLFSGLIRTIRKKKPTRGAMVYSLTANGWQFLMPRRLVGVPNGGIWSIPAGDYSEELPTPICVDPVADQGYVSPNPYGVQQLFERYWNFPWPIDLTTYVTDILPAGASAEGMVWTSTDLEGALNDVTAAGSAAAMWWLANDSPNPGTIVAPHLALHWGNVIIPDEGDDGDDLLAGFPSADDPPNHAPYDISDTPDGVTSILALSLDFTVDQQQRADGAYVRGATGFTMDVFPAAPGADPPYTTGMAHEGGTGWVGSPGGIWGEVYVDAPAAVDSEQRDAFGMAKLAASTIPSVSGTVVVVGYDGWHKGQAICVTDADYGFDARWFLIRAVSMSQHDPLALANEYTLTLGDTLSASLGYALREQRLREQRDPTFAPAMQFVAYMSDLQPAPGDTLTVRMQLASASGTQKKVKGVRARWSLIINGEWAADPFDASGLFWLSDQTTVSNEIGQVTAIMHAAAGATPDADAANVKADVVL